MDLKYDAKDEEFRQEIHAWADDNLPENYKKNVSGIIGTGTAEDRKIWLNRLAKKGWLCISWPKENGGTDWPMSRQVIFKQEMADMGAPALGMGPTMVGPLLIEYGTQEQKDRFLSKICSAEEQWCQGYSEPNAGSDLAGLQLAAERDGDDYVVNGQKVWTSGADQADWIFLLARTNPNAEKKQMGISFLLCPMDAPGLRIEPIRQINDHTGFYETFFTDVRIPVENRVGGENEGWTIAKRLLAHERGNFSGTQFKRTMMRLIELAASTRINGGVAKDDHAIRQKLAQLNMELDAMGHTSNRALTRLLQGTMPGPESSILKLYGSELFQRMCDVALDILGPTAQIWRDEHFEDIENLWPIFATTSRSYSIFSGTSEIQRNIISERVLGLPRS